MNKNMVCPVCGNQMEVYYKWWCPYCEKPESETMKVFNLIKCLKHLVARGLSGGKTYDELMDIVNDGYDFKNGTYFLFYLLEEEDMDEYLEDYVLFNNVITSNFDVGDGCLFEVSW